MKAIDFFEAGIYLRIRQISAPEPKRPSQQTSLVRNLVIMVSQHHPCMHRIPFFLSVCLSVTSSLVHPFIVGVEGCCT